jgi:hypothetical protein
VFRKVSEKGFGFGLESFLFYLMLLVGDPSNVVSTCHKKVDQKNNVTTLDTGAVLAICFFVVKNHPLSGFCLFIGKLTPLEKKNRKFEREVLLNPFSVFMYPASIQQMASFPNVVPVTAWQ